MKICEELGLEQPELDAIIEGEEIVKNVLPSPAEEVDEMWGVPAQEVEDADPIEALRRRMQELGE
jgi:hypothetical protein